MRADDTHMAPMNRLRYGMEPARRPFRRGFLFEVVNAFGVNESFCGRGVRSGRLRRLGRGILVIIGTGCFCELSLSSGDGSNAPVSLIVVIVATGSSLSSSAPHCTYCS
jgi:hypothetical protein